MLHFQLKFMSFNVFNEKKNETIVFFNNLSYSRDSMRTEENKKYLMHFHILLIRFLYDKEKRINLFLENE